MYTLTLNMVGINSKIVNAMIEAGKMNNFDIYYDEGYYLKFTSESGANYTRLIDQLYNICLIYGIDYVSLLG